MKDLPKTEITFDYNSFITLYYLLRQNQWLEDESIALYELWDKCDNNDKKHIVKDLLERFDYLTSRDIRDYCKEISRYIVDKWRINGKGTKIVAINDGKKPDGSQYILEAIKNKFSDVDGWTEENFRNSLLTMGEASYQLRNKQNLILLDDFVGTGKTIERKVIWLKEKIKEKRKKNIKIYFVAIAIMEQSIPIIKNLDIEFYAPLILKKGITDKYKGEEKEKYIDAMIDLEKLLADVYKKMPLPSFGYGKSETLFAIEGINVPNNVFPIFWWPVYKDNKKRKTILKRVR